MRTRAPACFLLVFAMRLWRNGAMSRISIPWHLVFWLLALCLPAAGEDGDPPEEIAYRVRFRGIDDDRQKARFEGLSQAVALQHRPPASVVLLERRAAGDVDRFQALLKSEGYFDGTVTPSIATTVTPARVVFEIERGPR